MTSEYLRLNFSTCATPALCRTLARAMRRMRKAWFAGRWNGGGHDGDGFDRYDHMQNPRYSSTCSRPGRLPHRIEADDLQDDVAENMAHGHFIVCNERCTALVGRRPLESRGVLPLEHALSTALSTGISGTGIFLFYRWTHDGSQIFTTPTQPRLGGLGCSWAEALQRRRGAVYLGQLGKGPSERLDSLG